jgi:hypothetical protein
LNELDDEWQRRPRAWTKEQKETTFTVITLSNSNSDDQRQIRLMFDVNLEFQVEISTATVQEPPWTMLVTRKMTQTGSQGRMLQKEKMRTFIQWESPILDNRAGTAWIHDSSMIIPFAEVDFHPVIKSLTKRFCKLFMQPSPSTIFIFALQQILQPPRLTGREIRADTLKQFISGHLRLYISLPSPDDEFELIHSQGESYSILHGWYIAPWARDILTKNSIDGLLLDTTWRVMRDYVTVILMAVLYNVGIPIALAFGPGETTELYEQIYEAFQNRFGIDLGTFPLESDQGSALATLCRKHQQIHLLCLRHFLVSLKQRRFSLQVGNLVKCRSEMEFQTLKDVYQSEFSEIIGDARKELNQTLAKAGLGFNGFEIVIIDHIKWDAVSMMQRVRTRMPSTTNALESTHGHLNEAISRRNPFWTSMLTIIDMMFFKVHHFEETLKHNWNRAVRSSMKRFRSVPAAQMAEEADAFNATLEDCQCAETVHLSALYHAHLPCSHQYFLNADRPIAPDEVKLVFNSPVLDLVYEEIVVERQVARAVHVHTMFLKKYATRNILRHSHTRDKDAVKAFVDENFTVHGPWALGLPQSVIKLTSRGIATFTRP